MVSPPSIRSERTSPYVAQDGRSALSSAGKRREAERPPAVNVAAMGPECQRAGLETGSASGLLMVFAVQP
jgi:hypothetical protein